MESDAGLLLCHLLRAPESPWRAADSTPPRQAQGWKNLGALLCSPGSSLLSTSSSPIMVTSSPTEDVRWAVKSIITRERTNLNRPKRMLHSESAPQFFLTVASTGATSISGIPPLKSRQQPESRPWLEPLPAIGLHGRDHDSLSEYLSSFPRVLPSVLAVPRTKPRLEVFALAELTPEHRIVTHRMSLSMARAMRRYTVRCRLSMECSRCSN